MILIIAFIAAICCKFLQSYIYKKYWNRALTVTMNIKKNQCFAGEDNVLEEVISNNKLLPLPFLHVKFNTPKSFLFENEDNSSVTDYYYRDDVFAILSHQCVKRQLKFNCSQRGCFHIHDTNITSSDLFLQNIYTDKIANNIIIYVFPKKIDVSFFEIPFNTITGNIITQKNYIDDPFEFKGIREYQPYDSIRNINWKSSAKTNALQVNTFFTTASQSVRVLLNLDTEIYSRDDKLIESIISLGSSLCEKFIPMNIPVGIDTNGIDTYTKEQLRKEIGSGPLHMNSIDSVLARIDTKAPLGNFSSLLQTHLENMDKNCYYIIITNNVHENIISLYKEFNNIGISSFLIIPELKHISVNTDLPNMIKWDVEY